MAEQNAQLRDLWGVPVGAPFNTGWVPPELMDLWWPGFRNDGYAVEVAGFVVRDEPPERWPCMGDPDGGYLWIVRFQAWPPATSNGQRNVFLRVDWEGSEQNSDLREEYSISGLRLEHTKEQVDTAYAALDRFREKFQVGYGGRPPSKDPSRNDVERWIGDAIRRVRMNARARGVRDYKPRRQELWRLTPRKKSEMYALVRQYGIDVDVMIRNGG